MAKRNDSILIHLCSAPWWVSVTMSLITYFGLASVLPRIFASTDNFILNAIGPNLPNLAPLFGFLFLIPAPISLIAQRNRKQRYSRTTAQLKSQRSTAALNDLSWIEFESYIGEFFKHQGYHVKQALSSAPDDGVDIWLTKNGDVSLVQCKHWKSRKVGVQVLREMYGVMLANQGKQMIIVTSGHFTSEAIRFAADKRFWLICGDELVNMVEDGRYFINRSSSEPSKHDENSVLCPKCQSELVLRTARKGKNSGKQFYGCSSFPKCRFTLNT
ncbi:hypothetical protein F0267_12465 [Vibrio coralliilyticus]|uniref:Membrane protein n=1 Tax=Vibrio coralliilyticus TaxID=190893 RepID=A0AAN0VZL5_9VIBR|nr:restriction endonuclease [Vibrio coralliilyticus]AIW21652.1 membrane protein [Vibrio coralliilyticus]NOH39053.1 hypothetical protein [Vibrio coralliilyticus]